MFGKLKDWHRIATRYDQCAHTFIDGRSDDGSIDSNGGRWCLNVAELTEPGCYCQRWNF